MVDTRGASPWAPSATVIPPLQVGGAAMSIVEKQVQQATVDYV